MFFYKKIKNKVEKRTLNSFGAGDAAIKIAKVLYNF